MKDQLLRSMNKQGEGIASLEVQSREVSELLGIGNAIICASPDDSRCETFYESIQENPAPVTAPLICHPGGIPLTPTAPQQSASALVDRLGLGEGDDAMVA